MREFQIKLSQHWVQIISPCSQWLARCHVTRHRCSAAPAPKFSAKQKRLYVINDFFTFHDFYLKTF